MLDGAGQGSSPEDPDEYLAESGMRRSVIDYDRLRLTLTRLQDQHDNYRQLDPSLPAITHEAVMESVIRRFGMCYECLWRSLKWHLIDALGIPDLLYSPKPVFRCAFENNLLEGPPERWFDYAEHRVRTSQGYDPKHVADCLEVVSNFIDDAVALYETMADQSWPAPSQEAAP